ncbi:hypothetical protein J1605_018081 [Eschrichtius robustus]|uniref:Phospholipase B1, membrane-associated n=1 Tax=Eschrichtius robustus TaxID=9764 RepID=A0AB34HY90_ESCRO|nr:hypothetical protein J1605_018081 [Eschrichtius robustus]
MSSAFCDIPDKYLASQCWMLRVMEFICSGQEAGGPDEELHGGNDLCDVCDDPVGLQALTQDSPGKDFHPRSLEQCSWVRYSPQNFTDNIGKALDILHAEVQRPGHTASGQLSHRPPPWASVLAWRRLWLPVETSLPGPLLLDTSTDRAVSPGPSSLSTYASTGSRGERGGRGEGCGWGQMKGHRPDSQQETPAPAPGERLEQPGLDPLGDGPCLCSGASGVCEPGKDHGDHQPEGAVPGEDCQVPEADPPFDDNSTELASLIEVNKKYQEGTHQLVESGRYDTREDFTVVVQPFFEKVEMPKTPEGLPDSSFFAPDCFHFSRKAHAHAAWALWNNMLEPVGQKTRRHEFEDKVNITCPDQLSGESDAKPASLAPGNPEILGFILHPQDHGSRLLCSDRAPSASPPASVHTLRPADIQVVAALGDSLTAGNGIGSKPNDLSDVTTQYRGLSYSSGGDSYLEKVTTLPSDLGQVTKHCEPQISSSGPESVEIVKWDNILRKFNGNLTGYAVGTGNASDTNAFLNQAVPGTKARELSSQVQTLIQKMKDDHRVNFHEDWKVITVLIGGSDLCDYCTDSNLYSAANFFDHLRNALDILHREVPRALVNLVDFMSPRVMRHVFLENPDKCPVQQASILCNCVLTLRESSQELARLEAVTRAYQNSMRELVESGRYDTREDFSVVLQPFFYNIRLPILADGRPDVSFFAPDCLHPNQKFHSQLSRALWVNMLEPLGKKTDTLDLTADIPLPCPDQDEPFLRTPRNSNYTYPTKPSIENWGSDFLCEGWNPSNSVPTSVHELRPADIKAVAALGDSLTVSAEPGRALCGISSSSMSALCAALS